MINRFLILDADMRVIFDDVFSIEQQNELLVAYIRYAFQSAVPAFQDRGQQVAWKQLKSSADRYLHKLQGAAAGGL